MSWEKGRPNRCVLISIIVLFLAYLLQCWMRTETFWIFPSFLHSFLLCYLTAPLGCDKFIRIAAMSYFLLLLLLFPSLLFTVLQGSREAVCVAVAVSSRGPVNSQSSMRALDSALARISLGMSVSTKPQEWLAAP